MTKRDKLVQRAMQFNRSATVIINVTGKTSKVTLTFTGGSLEVSIGSRGVIVNWSSAGLGQLAHDIVYFILSGNVVREVKGLI